MKNRSSLLINPETTNASIYNSISDKVKIIYDTSIPSRFKAVKNSVEINNIRNVMMKDGVALTKFFFWLENSVGKQLITESSAASKLLEFRLQQADCSGTSFSTIVAYQKNGALVHYSPVESSDAILRQEGILLIDSGGQYLNGTTDITRTISLGVPDQNQKVDFTLVLKGFINLAMAKFPAGTKGYQLDILARKALWDNGLNYGHGTGHGVGFFLNVHEGPFSIGTGAQGDNAGSLVPGLVFSDEPGLYRDGKYGIRTENMLLVSHYMENEFGQFLQFETLSLCYIDTELVDRSLLTPSEIQWLNSYHSEVYEKISTFLTDNEKNWLKEKTREI